MQPDAEKCAELRDARVVHASDDVICKRPLEARVGFGRARSARCVLEFEAMESDRKSHALRCDQNLQEAVANVPERLDAPAVGKPREKLETRDYLRHFDAVRRVVQRQVEFVLHCLLALLFGFLGLVSWRPLCVFAVLPSSETFIQLARD